jgi:hypothetical protein
VLGLAGRDDFRRRVFWQVDDYQPQGWHLAWQFEIVHVETYSVLTTTSQLAVLQQKTTSGLKVYSSMMQHQGSHTNIGVLLPAKPMPL